MEISVYDGNWQKRMTSFGTSVRAPAVAHRIDPGDQNAVAPEV